MTVLFAGGELSSFSMFNAIETTLTNSFSTPARCGIHTMKGGYIRTDTLGDVSEIWLHFDVNIALVTSGLSPINITNSTGTSLFSITSDSKVYVGTVLVGTVPFMIPGFCTLDLHLLGGSSGLVEVYANSQLVFSASGNFSLGGMHSLILSPTGFDTTTTTNTVYSQVIASTEVTVGSKLATLVLTSVGSNSAWTGTTNDAAADINEIVLNNNTYISAQTAGLVETWTTSDLDSSYTNVRAIIVSALGKYSTTGPKNLDAVVRINNANYYTTMTALGSGYVPSQAIFATNPVTNASWATSDVNAAEFGIRTRV